MDVEYWIKDYFSNFDLEETNTASAGGNSCVLSFTTEWYAQKLILSRFVVSSWILLQYKNIREKNKEIISRWSVPVQKKKKKNINIYCFFPFLQWNNLRHTNYVRSNWIRNVIKILNEKMIKIQRKSLT